MQVFSSGKVKVGFSACRYDAAYMLLVDTHRVKKSLNIITISSGVVVDIGWLLSEYWSLNAALLSDRRKV